MSTDNEPGYKLAVDTDEGQVKLTLGSLTLSLGAAEAYQLANAIEVASLGLLRDQTPLPRCLDSDCDGHAGHPGPHFAWEPG